MKAKRAAGKAAGTKRRGARAPAKKAAAKKKPSAKKKAAATKKAAPAKERVTTAERTGPHPKLRLLTAKMPPGRHAGGLLHITTPGAEQAELRDWLMGNDEGRTSLGRTAFGEPVVFRDLRERARDLGQPDADLACDVAIVDIHFKRMKVPSTSVEEWLASLDDADWQRAYLRKDLYEAAKVEHGDYADDECFGFVPALALGGAEAPEFVRRQKWRVHQALLIQS